MPAPATTADAIVLSHVDTGESDRIVRLLTPDHGRLSALARRARGSTKRFGGALDAGNRVSAALRPGRDELWHLDSASLTDDRRHARSDLVRLSLLLYCCEVAGSLAREGHPEPRLFGLLETGASLLDAVTGPPTDTFRMAFELKALTFSGIRPHLEACARCGMSLEGPLVWSPDTGGVTHEACAPGPEHVTAAWAQALELARRTPLQDLIDAPCPDGPRWVFAQAVEAHAGRALKSRGVLAALRTTR